MLDSQVSQLERLEKQIGHWTQLSRANKDVLIMGDANVCALKWNDEITISRFHLLLLVIFY